MKVLALLLLAATSAYAQPGAVDLSFGDADGIVFGTQYDTVLAADIAAAPDGSVYLITQMYPFGGGPLRRYTPDGRYDTTFGQPYLPALVYNAWADTASTISYPSVNARAGLADAEGRLVIAGMLYGRTGWRPPILARLTTAGRLDSTFGSGGAVALGGFKGEARAIDMSGDRIVVTIDDTQSVPPPLEPGERCAVGVLTLDGQPDPAFGPYGVRVIETPAGVRCNLRSITTTGDVIVAAGTLQTDSTSTAVAFAFRRDGTVLESFGDNGRARFGAGYGTAISRRPGGFAVTTLEPTANSLRLVVRALTPDGAPDPTFASDGMLRLPPYRRLNGYESGTRSDLAVDREGRILVGYPETPSGGGRPVQTVRRLRPDGSADEAWGMGGVSYAYTNPSKRPGIGMPYFSIDGDGRLVVMSSRDTYVSGPPSMMFVRLLGGDAVGVEALPSRTAALSIAPNPVRGTARVSFALDAPTEARITVVDALGRTVAVLADARLGTGRHAVSLDAARLPAGVYAVVARLGAEQTVRRITVIR